jgi:hypothetical protein
VKKFSINVLQQIKLEVMLGEHKCQDIKSMTAYSDLYKLVRPTRENLVAHTFSAGGALMIRVEEAQAVVTDIELNEDQAKLLKEFITNWQGGWTVGDNEWVQDLLSKL